MVLQGNCICGKNTGYGRVCFQNGVIERIEFSGEVKADADWVVPGFIDTHIHGLGEGEAVGEGIRMMAEFAPSTGMTGIVPALATASEKITMEYLQTIREGMSEHYGARILGAHLEGPFLELPHAGGMDREQLRNPDVNEVRRWLECAAGTLKIVTIAPELPGAPEVIELLKSAGVSVALGHTGMSAEMLPDAADAGVDRVCHLFDAYSGRDVDGGVLQLSLADAVLIDDRLTIELIPDGFHVPAGLIRLAARAAGVDRIVAVSDAMKGTGQPDGVYAEPDGRLYKLENAGVCRLLDPPYGITGSCLTMNRAFSNLVHKFGFTPAEAAQMTSGNPARSIGMEDKLGKIAPGYIADIVLLAPDMLTVKNSWGSGRSLLD